MPILRTAGVLAAALALTACGTEQHTSTPQPTSTTATTTSTIPTTTTPPNPTAKDGKDFAQCADGSCEVAIGEPGTIAVAGHSFVVKSVADDGLEFELRLAGGGTASGTLKGTCGSIMKFYTDGTGGGTGTFCNPDNAPQPAPTPEPGVFQLQLAGLNDHQAIVRMVTG
ncbi:MAG: hypothetical protein QOF58_2298 [Pseudonocardiales bacterium]|jgi:hypothetical protein|nr:hypothetical protein [Pseudonocardiales bacterium]